MIIANRHFDFTRLLKDYSSRNSTLKKIKKKFFKTNEVFWEDFNVIIEFDNSIKNFSEVILADIWEIYYEKIYDKYFSKERNYNNIIDCGANIGLFSLYASKNFKVNKIHTFEASKKICDNLIKNVNLNNLTNKIAVNNNYVSSNEENINFLFDNDIFTMSKISSSTSGESVQAITLDSYIKEKKINKIDLIKMDIEGSELEALKGSNFLLKNLKPHLIISAYHSPEQLIDIISYIHKLEPKYIISIPKNKLVHPIVYAHINTQNYK